MAEDATEFSPLGALDVVGLEDGFRGELLRPADTGYEDARKVWNGSINRFPALVARCAEFIADSSPAAKVPTYRGGTTPRWSFLSLPTPPRYTRTLCLGYRSSFSPTLRLASMVAASTAERASSSL